MILDSRFFGSRVRGDDDDESDVDVLVVSETWSAEAERAFVERLGSDRPNRLSISVYGPRKIADMFSGGDLFAWHLYEESLPTGLHPDWLAGCFPPAPYPDSWQTVGVFENLADDLHDAVLRRDVLLPYDAGLVYSIARNVAMAASWHSSGGLVFSRDAPYRLPEVSLAGFVPRALYDRMVAARLSGQRGSDAPVLSGTEYREALEGTRHWIEDVRRKLQPGNQHLPEEGCRGTAGAEGSSKLG